MARTALPKKLALDVEIPALAPGLVGLVQAVAATLEHADAGFDADDLVAISTAAFTTYVFDPVYNQHEDEPRGFSPHAEMFSNFGPWGAISRMTGWQLREVSDLPAVETMKLVAFELAAGRPLITLDEDLSPQVITSYAIDVGEKTVTSHLGHVWDIENGHLQADDDIFRDWMLVVKPGEVQEWTASVGRQRIDVLRWAVEHGHKAKEFFQETRENYKPGLLGLERFQQFLGTVESADEAAFAERFVQRMRAGRAAAAATIPQWIPSIVDVLEKPGVRAPLEEAADSYGHAAAALSSDLPFVEMFREVAPAEHAALAALARAARDFPGVFEA